MVYTVASKGRGVELGPGLAQPVEGSALTGTGTTGTGTNMYMTVQVWPFLIWPQCLHVYLARGRFGGGLPSPFTGGNTVTATYRDGTPVATVCVSRRRSGPTPTHSLPVIPVELQ